MRKLLMLLLLLAATATSAQKIPDYGFNKIRIALSDRIVQADLSPLKTEPTFESDKLYYWSGSNAIHTTQGGFSGKLLNGDYNEFYLNKNLKAQGQFKAGLKHGVWRSWNENGLLTELYKWKDGVRSGKFELFGSDGKPLQKGYYSNNLLNGKIENYAADGSIQTVNYRKGKILEKKESFLKKIKRLKKGSTNTPRIPKTANPAQ